MIWGRYYIEIVRDALLQGGGWPATWYKVLDIAVTGAIFYGLAWRTHAAHAGEGISHEKDSSNAFSTTACAR